MGFEPTGPVTGTNGFQDRRLRPLGHPPGRSVVARHLPGGLTCRDERRGYRDPAAGSEVPDDLYRRLVESVSVVTYAMPHGQGVCVMGIQKLISRLMIHAAFLNVSHLSFVGVDEAMAQADIAYVPTPSRPRPAPQG